MQEYFYVVMYNYVDKFIECNGESPVGVFFSEEDAKEACDNWNRKNNPNFGKKFLLDHSALTYEKVPINKVVINEREDE